MDSAALRAELARRGFANTARSAAFLQELEVADAPTLISLLAETADPDAALLALVRLGPDARRIAEASPECFARVVRAEAMTQRCADVLGDVVRSHTYDWHMMQRVFTDDAPSELPAASRVDRGRRGTRGRQGSREGRGIRECRGTREGRGTRGDA